MRSPTLRRRLICAGVAVLVALISSSDASASSWTSPSGANTAFGWSSGFNNTDRFGQPTVTSIGFLFDQTVNFVAQGGGGTGASTTDFARVTLDTAGSVPAGAPLVHFIKISEWGTWSEDKSQPSDFTVQADFQVFRFVPTPTGTTGVIQFGSNTGYFTFNPNGTWSAERTLTVGEAGNPPRADLDWRRFQVTVTDTIQVASSAPAGSFIEKTGMRIIVPEPTTVLFLVAGFGPLVLRRAGRR